MNGIPILQPIWMRFKEHFDDLITLDPSSLFVIGNQLIGVNMFTIEEKGIAFLNKKAPSLYEISSGQKMNGFMKKNEKDMIVKLVVGGSIIPWNEEIQICSYYVIKTPLSLKVFLDKDNKAMGTLYFDNGYEVDTKGHFIYLDFEFNKDNLTITNKNNKDLSQWEDKDIIPIWNNIEIYGYHNNIDSYSIDDKVFNYASDTHHTKGIVINLKEYNIKINRPLLSLTLSIKKSE